MTGKDFDYLNEAYLSKVNAATGAMLEKKAKPDYTDVDGDGKKKKNKTINEAFANATSKVTTDQPAKKDEVVTEKHEAPKEAVQDKQTAKCDHPGCKDGTHTDGSDCKKCGGDGWISANDLSDKEKTVANEKSTDQRPKGEVDADDIEDGGCDQVHDDLQEPVEGDTKEDKKETKKSKKTAKESINNSSKGNIMSENKSTFDELYESVMSEDEDFELGLPTGDETDELDLGDDEGGDVTVTLSPAHVDCLKEILDQVGGNDDGGEDEAGEDPDTLEAGYHEDNGVTEEDTQHTKDGSKVGVDPSDGGGKTTEPAADSLGGKSSGSGSTSVTDEIDGGKDTGEGKKPGHTKAKNTPTV